MARLLENLWLRLGEVLGRNYSWHHPEIFLATRTDQLKGEFGLYVAAAMFGLQWCAQTYVRAEPGLASCFLALSIFLFVVMARCRQSFFKRFLTPTRLLQIVAGR